MHHKHQTSHCRDLLAQISDYIDGELEAALCTELEQHLADCENCRVVVDTTRKTVILYRRYDQVELPEGALYRLWQTLAQKTGSVDPSSML